VECEVLAEDGVVVEVFADGI